MSSSNPPEEKEVLPTHPPEVEEPAVESIKAPAPAPAPAPESPKPTGEPVDKEKILSFVEELIDTLTFKRVGLIALLLVVSIALFALFESRTGIITRITLPPPVSKSDVPIPIWVLSDKSKTELQQIATTTDISFISVSDVDLQKNRRVIKYYFLDDPTIKLSPELIQALGLPQVVFDYDANNTAQMVSVLSNEFRCNPYKDTIFFRFAPDLQDRMPQICRLAIPPFVGQFVGFITIGTARLLSKNELDSLRLEVARIAVEIYLNDVKKTPITQ